MLLKGAGSHSAGVTVPSSARSRPGPSLLLLFLTKLFPSLQVLLSQTLAGSLLNLFSELSLLLSLVLMLMRAGLSPTTGSCDWHLWWKILEKLFFFLFLISMSWVLLYYQWECKEYKTSFIHNLMLLFSLFLLVRIQRAPNISWGFGTFLAYTTF